ncbi:MAG: SfnB family sulfur acquisition oxidoreductase [Acidocella sp.]|nr:SfnB family sulfur acquisition oxidoreductase [Acidocella sp.]
MTTATIIKTEDEAIAAARRLADKFREGAAERDAQRRLPWAELDESLASGLWGITIPREYGGAFVRQRVVAEVFRILASGDSSLAQIPQNHVEIIDVLRQTGSDAQKRLIFGRVLQGARLGNAFSEYKGKNVEDFQTRIRREGDFYVVNGEKFYSTGALYAHLVPIVAISEDDGKIYVAIAERVAPGLTVIDNWDGFGQRTTASGTVKIENVYVPAEYVVPAHIAYENPSPAGPQSQILHAAIDLGIAEAAIEKTIDFVRNHARPWIDAHQDHAWEDPYSIAAIGDLKIRFNAAVEVLAEAGDVTDIAIANPTLENIGRAKIAVAEAKVLTTEIAILATNKLFELAGTRSTLGKYNLDRLWRDARTHTLHDPLRWKYPIIGKYYLTGEEPPLHSWI